jgi:endonuclease/exonuclease/phosphatase family metal-dependent hydrolase
LAKFFMPLSPLRYGLAICLCLTGPSAYGEVPRKNEAPSNNTEGEGKEAGGFSVMTWNLEWFYDDSKKDNYSQLALEKASPSRGEWNWKRDAVADAIAKVKPSVLAVQEIEGQRVLWYLTRALDREHKLEYNEFVVEGNDFFTEQDVGLLVTEPVDVVSMMRGNVTSRMKKTKKFGSVSKHVAAILEVPVGNSVESVLVVNVHFRSGEKGAAIRAKQATSLNHWIARWRTSLGSPHVIVTGDFNTEQSAGMIQENSELAILLSRSTLETDDDLIDLHESIPMQSRQTHLNPGKQFDRILASRSLVEDTRGVADLTLRRVEVRRDLVVQGNVDTPTQHWDEYWKSSSNERDLSDHYPVVAEFIVQ